MLMHNHPSGDPQPSTDDINLTHQIIAVGKPLKVAVHDHLIIGKQGHVSLKGLRIRGVSHLAKIRPLGRPNRTKMFHVKHFCPVGAKNLTRPNTCPP
jgi:hypothetical protein